MCSSVFCNVVLFLLLLLKGNICQHVTEQEIENFINVGAQGRKELITRMTASGNKSVHMYTGDTILLKICPKQQLDISIDKIYYSNDGPEDRVLVHVDDVFVGTLQIEAANLGWGRFWNEFKDSGPIGSNFSVSPGEHVIKLTAELTDFYGTELDKILLATSKNINDYEFWCRIGMTSSTTAPVTTVPAPAVPSVSSTLSTPESIVGVKSGMAKPVETKGTVMPPFVEQLSQKTKCLDVPNVKIKFNPSSLQGVEMISKASPILRKKQRSTTKSAQENDWKTCKSTIWQIGVVDGKPSQPDVPDQREVIVFDVSGQKDQNSHLPMTIDPSVTKKISLRFKVPKDISLKQGAVYFTVGLVGINKDTKLGVQYYDHKHRNQSITEFLKFKPNQPVIGWALPSRAIAKRFENEINIFFDTTSTTPIRFDFLRLDYTHEETNQMNVRFVRLRRFSITGAAYKQVKNQPLPKGMSVSVDAGKQTRNVAKVNIVNVQFARKVGPVWNKLTIEDNGNIFPLHEDRLSRKQDRNVEGRKIDKVSGFILGDPNNPITNIHVNRGKSEIVIHYEDSTNVSLIYYPEKGRTRLVVRESSLKDNSITFFSTFVTDNMAAVNNIETSIGEVKGVMDNLDGLKSGKFTFEKTSQNPLFHASAKYEIVFPEKVVPK